MLHNMKISEAVKITAYTKTSAGPADVAWVDATDFDTFLAVVLRANPTAGALDEFKILGNTAADGSGTDIELADYATNGTLANVDTAGEYAVLEIDQSVFDANPTVKGVSVSLGLATGTDHASVFYVLGGSRTLKAGLTTENVSA